MHIHEKFLQITIEFAKHKNPSRPYAAIIVNAAGKILAKGVGAMHISPTFHGETVAINTLAEKFPGQILSNLTLYTTCECCPMCQTAIHWANVMGYQINTVIFGSRLDFSHMLWGHEVKLHSHEIVARSPYHNIKLIGPVLEDECNTLFLNAKQLQNNSRISNKIEYFCE